MRGLVLVDWGPERNGIVTLGRTLASRGPATAVAVRELEHLPTQLPPDTRFVHFHVSDWLFPEPARAAEVVTAVVDQVHARRAEVTVTLHDLPQPGEGPDLFARRSAGYRAMAAVVDRVIVCSEHERELLADIGSSTRVTVVPLPVSSRPRPAVRNGTPVGNVVGIFGFLFPGKGHAEVIAALTGFTPRLTVRAIGAPADRHPELTAELTAQAAAAGLDFESTGFVRVDTVVAHLQAVAVPLVPQTKISASGSLNSWLMAGRRPWVVDSRYAREVLHRMPGSLQLYGPGELPRAASAALADPTSTWLPADFALTPTVAQVAAAYRAVIGGGSA